MRARFLIITLLVVAFGCYGTVDPPDDDDNDDSASGDDDDTAVDDDDATDDDDTTPPPDDDDVADDDDTTPPPDDDDATDPPSEIVRWVAMGDTGTGSDDQYAVAGAIETVCAAQGCDFVVLLGDNFYDEGVESITDPLWDAYFEAPYADIDLSFYPTLGNHDGGAGGTGLDMARGDIQVDYTATSDKWEMPARWYKHSHGAVDLYSIDTSSIFFDGGFLCGECDDNADDQAAWLQSEWAGGSTGTWRIVYGHHPYLSNGPHGNAGMYEGIPLLPYVSGDEIKGFLETNVCGSVDLYLCGHDHSRQWQQDTCDGTSLIVAGGGAKRSDIEGDNPVWWQDPDNDTEGFVWFEADGDTLTIQFWNKNGVMDYEGQLTK